MTAMDVAFPAPSVSVASPWERRLDAASEWLFTAPQRADAFVQRQTASASGGGILGGAAKAVGWLRKAFLDYDYRTHITLPLRNGGHIRIAQPSIGACSIMLLFFTIAPRLFKAVQRAENNDYSEFWDVLRRDTLTVTTLLYALDPLRTVMANAMQKKAGIRLLDDDGALMKADKTALSYRASSPGALAGFLRTPGNRPDALEKALDQFVARWQAHHPDAAASASLDALKRTVSDIIAAHGNDDARAVDALSRRAYETIQRLDGGWRETQLASLPRKARQRFSSDVPLMRNFLTRFADKRRLPVSVGSFALVCLGVGWFPVEFNRQWNRYRYLHAKSQPLPAASPFPDAGGIQRSALWNRTFHA